MHVKPPLALLIDGDQVPAETIGPLLDRLEKQWTVDERVCVRNWRSTKDQQGWRAVDKPHGAHDREPRCKRPCEKFGIDICVISSTGQAATREGDAGCGPWFDPPAALQSK